MKKKICLLGIIIMMTSSVSNSQSGWIDQNSGVLIKLNKVFFLNSQTGWVTGDLGKILKTTNSGNNWTLQISNTGHDLRSVFFLNASTGYAAGGNYTPFSLCFKQILKTTNGGNNWLIVYDHVDNEVSLSDVNFLNENTGFATGFGGNDSKAEGQILTTTNAGVNWVQTDYGSSFKNICFTDQNTGWIASSYYHDVLGEEARIYKTSNGGVNWEMNYSLPQAFSSSLFFIDNNTGWLAGLSRGGGLNQDLILKTSDGGSTWLDLNLNTLSFIQSIYFQNHDTGWYCGDKIYRSTNGGINWINQLADGNVYNSITFVDNNTGWAVGTNGKISSTITGGITSVSALSENLPDEFSLSQNYPNPFNPRTVINYDLRVTGNAKLVLYDVLGNEVAELVNEKQNAGSYSVEFDGSNYASGIYFYKLTVGDFKETKRMMLIK
ncbi:MAG: T9SS type A sorting domain-containing protein [Ignavibacteria bacterium]